MTTLRESTFKKIESVVNDNGCKCLDSSKKKSFWYYFRSRSDSSMYFVVECKGNFIRAYRIRYILKSGKSVNVFIGCQIPAICGGNPEIPFLKKEMILKKRFKEFESFLKEFKEITPELSWYDR